MSDILSSAPYPASDREFAKQNPGFLSFQISDILAPHPEVFDLELDTSLADCSEYQLQLLTVDSHDAYHILRSDTPTCGPLSAISVSDDSAYDTHSAYSESYYTNPTSPYASSTYSFPLDLDMDFQRIRVDAMPDYAAVAVSPQQPTVDPTSFGTLPPTPPRSPPAASPNVAKPYDMRRTSYSDYGPPTRSIPSADFYAALTYDQGTVSPSHVSPQLPVVPAIPAAHMPADDNYKGDPRKKYKCGSCPRAFARAYNLKTHMATHDPDRLKPHVCPHRACGRSFSRKHDLGRHLVSIHRTESVSSSQHSAKSAVGVDTGPRGWCDTCGKGWVGRSANCGCPDT